MAGRKKTRPSTRGRSLVPVVAVLVVIICVLSVVIIKLLPMAHNNRAENIGAPAGPTVTVTAAPAAPEQPGPAADSAEPEVELPDEPPILSPSPAPEPTPDLTGYYIFPDSDRRYLTEEDLCGLNEDSLLIARNEIYARRGRMFDDADLQSYFDRQPWYTPTIAAQEFTHTILNNYEVWNASFILDYESRQ